MESVSVSSPRRRFKLSKVILSWYGILLAYVFIIGLFLILRNGNGNNPVILNLGALSFRWYGVIITAGVVIASFLAQFLADRRGDDPDHVWRVLPVLLISGILMARLWYVAFTWDGYKDYIFSIGNPTHAGAIEIWRGGIAIQGAVLGGLLGTLGYGYFWNRSQARKQSSKPPFNIWRFADFVAPGLVLAQGMGRWGNFMNNEAYGRETKYGWGIKIPCEFRTSGATPGTNDTLCPIAQSPQYGTPTAGIDQNALFHPTFFYESIWDYTCFLVLFYCVMKPKTVERRFKIKLRDGDIFLLYWVIYSIGRFFVEGLRIDSLYFGGNNSGLRSAQVTALVAIFVAAFLLIYRHRKDFPPMQRLSMRLAPVGVAAGTAASIALPDQLTEEEAETETDEDEDTAAEATADAEDGGDELDVIEQDLDSDVDTDIEPVEEAEDINEVESSNLKAEVTELADEGETKLNKLDVIAMSETSGGNDDDKSGKSGESDTKDSGHDSHGDDNSGTGDGASGNDPDSDSEDEAAETRKS